ncbi:MAG: glycine zipper 2TM domain-containing protein [Proteobacteria bacterium]|nr:glycine zipper 2TM domain-containing protein [Pseudomonadota bacterium]
MFRRTAHALVLAAITLGASTIAANALCERHHPTGTILGAVGGGVVGSAVTHGNGVGVVGGAIVGGLAGNSIERSGCKSSRHRREGYYDRDHRWHRYS